MRILRVFAIRSYDHRYAYLKTGNESRYKREDIQRDFHGDLNLIDAEIALYNELGWPPEKREYKYPPDQFVRITNHTYCEAEPELGKVEEVRATQSDLFSGVELKKCLQDSPKLQQKKK